MLMPAVVAEDEFGVQLPTVSVGDLMKAGSVQLLGPVRAAAGDEPLPNGLPVLTVDDIVAGRAATGSGDTGLSPEIPLRDGDVVVPMPASELIARVIIDGGPLLGRSVQLLRCDPQSLDPWFLAGYLRTSANERQTSRVSGSGRFDIRRAQVPRIPLAEQRRHGEVFKRMQQFDDAVRNAAVLSNDFTRRVVDGMANGLLRPGEHIDDGSIR
jgi:hypothetical protein